MLRTVPDPSTPLGKDRSLAGPGDVNRATALRDVAIVVVLIVATLVTFRAVAQHEFLLWDDDAYVTANPMVRRGLSREGFRWAWRTEAAANWHPLTWLSHMLDCELFGSDAAAAPRHHQVNLSFHAANAALLYVLLRSLGCPSLAAVLATALFALHPLRVESVAWVAQRKDLLGLFFALLTLLAYVFYARRTTSWWRYGAVNLVLACGLAAKPTLVVLPVWMIVFDIWPLGRYAGRSRRDALRLWQEKLPLFALAIVAGALTFVAQSRAGALSSAAAVSPLVRVENALVAIGGYLRFTAWPQRLSYFYPHPGGHPPAAAVVASFTLIALVTAWCVWQARKRPYVLIGWLLFLVALVPALGLIQVGAAAMADRYTYLPHVGLALVAAFGLAELFARLDRPAWRWAVAIPVAFAALLLAVQTSARAEVWHDTLRLADDALSTDPDNPIALSTRGQTLAAEQRHGEAIECFRRSLREAPWLAETHTLLAYSLAATQQPAEALRETETALALKPRQVMANYIRGNLLLERGDLDGAAAALERAVDANPQFAAAWCDLALIALRRGQLDDAEAHGRRARAIDPQLATAPYILGLIAVARNHPPLAQSLFADAIALEPRYAEARWQLAVILADERRVPEAIAQLELVVAQRRSWWLAANELAWHYATAPAAELRNPPRAVELAEAVCRATARQQVEYLDTLAAAYAVAGRWAEAVATIDEALARLAPASSERPALEARAAAYRRQQAWVEP